MAYLELPKQSIQPGGLNNRNGLCRSAGGQNSEVKVLAPGLALGHLLPVCSRHLYAPVSGSRSPLFTRTPGVLYQAHPNDLTLI